MSWQATAWAVNQKTGNPSRKLLLLVLANYADADGVCWPSQGLLAEQTGMSLDTVQRQTKQLIACGYLSVSRPPKRRGQWQTFIYYLQMPIESTPPQNAARSSSDVRDQSTAIRSEFDSQNDPNLSPPLARLPRADDHSAVRPGAPQPDAGPQRHAASSPKPGRTAMRLILQKKIQ